MIYNYKIHVLNRDINFDMSYKNVVQFFNPADNTKDYTGVFTNAELTFDETYNENATDIINFDANDGINASVTLDFTGNNVTSQFLTSALTIQQALSRQYCIIDEIIYNDNGVKQSNKLYFYFITGYSLRNENIIKYNLVLDAFTTYPLFSDVSVDKTKISRAHTNRFTNASTLSSATFNLNNEFLETGEPLDNEYIKIRKDNKNVILKNICGTNFQNLGSTPLNNDTLKDIINNTLWLYVMTREPNYNKLCCAPYISKKTQYNIKYWLSHTINYTQDGHYIDANFMYDELAENAKVYNAYISPFGFFGTINNNITNYRIAYYYNNLTQDLDIVFLCEFEPIADDGYDNYNLYNSYELENPDTKIEKQMFYWQQYSNYIYMSFDESEMLNNVISYFESEDITLFNDTLTSLNNTYNYDIIEATEIKSKIRGAYNEFKIKSQFDDGETIIDLNVLKTATAKIKIVNNLNPSNDGDVFITLNDIWKRKFGITSKIQYTPLFYSDKFREYQATNKNYRITGQAIPIVSGTLGGMVAGAKIGGIYGAIAGGIVGFGASAYKVHTNFDNMQNTPDAIKLKGQNITIDKKITPSFVYLEHNELRPEDLKAVNLYFYEYGYNISIIDNISNYFTRSSFNFIQLDDCEKDVHALINKNVLDVIIKALNNGVRFWTKTHYANDKFKYTTNNLENSLL